MLPTPPGTVTENQDEKGGLHCRFVALREDKKARAVVREKHESPRCYAMNFQKD